MKVLGLGATIPNVVFTELDYFSTFDSTLAWNNIGTGASYHSADSGVVSPANPKWIAVDMTTPYTVTTYRMYKISTTYTDEPINYYLQGSNDYSSWTIVDTRINDPLPSTSAHVWSGSSTSAQCGNYTRRGVPRLVPVLSFVRHRDAR